MPTEQLRTAVLVTLSALLGELALAAILISFGMGAGMFVTVLAIAAWVFLTS